MITERPDSIMINVPAAFFRDDPHPIRKFIRFCRYYEAMGTDRLPDGSFFHFISQVPVHQDLLHVFVCFSGHVIYKAHLVQFIRNSKHPVPGLEWDRPHHFCVTTGPVVKAPERIRQRGFRGFRYCKEIF